MEDKTLKIEGLRELKLALRQTDKATRAIVRGHLAHAGEPVLQEGRRVLERYSRDSASGFRTRVWGKGYGVFVEQSKRRVTGRRRDWALKQQAILRKALDDKAGEVEREMELALDDLVRVFERG